MQTAHSDGTSNAPEVVLKALRAADRLGIDDAALAKIIGVSKRTVSRMRRGDSVFRHRSKSFELAVLFIRFYRSLDTIVRGNDGVAADWLRNKNVMLDAVPLDLIQTVSGLNNVIAYTDSRPGFSPSP